MDITLKNTINLYYSNYIKNNKNKLIYFFSAAIFFSIIQTLGITFLCILLQYFNLDTYSEFCKLKFYDELKINGKKIYKFNYIEYIQLFKNNILFNHFIADILTKINNKIKQDKNPDIIIYLMYIIKLMINRVNNTIINNLDDLIERLNKLFEL